MAEEQSPARRRREPPPLRPVTVTHRDELSPRMLRLRFRGPGIADMVPVAPAASVRLLVPSPGTADLVMPGWNGNEFLLPDGSRPSLRTFTPRPVDTDPDRLELWIVRHPGGAVSDWAETVTPGAPAALSGPGRGHALDADARHHVLLGDETALPAVDQLLGVLGPDTTVAVHLEIEVAEARIPIAHHPGATVSWHVRARDEPPGASLVAAATTLDPTDPGLRVWAGGEAAAMQSIRTVLFRDGGLPRDCASIRGYWKPAR
jgi:NADPH-dependent ferric siderophore reductase